jgi:hypothetical protein
MQWREMLSSCTIIPVLQELERYIISSSLSIFVQKTLTKLQRDVTLLQIIVLIFCKGVYLKMYM